MTRFLCVSPLLFACALAAPAQAPANPVPVAAEAYWHEAQQHDYPGGVYIVTIAAPAIRIPCRVRDFDAKQITCKRFLHKATAYRTDEVQAILSRRYDSKEWPSNVAAFGIGGGVLTGAVFLAMLGPFGIAAAVPVGLIGLIIPPLALGFGDPGAQHVVPGIAYLRPGATLEVPVQ